MSRLFLVPVASLSNADGRIFSFLLQASREPQPHDRDIRVNFCRPGTADDVYVPIEAIRIAAGPFAVVEIADNPIGLALWVKSENGRQAELEKAVINTVWVHCIDRFVTVHLEPIR